MVIHLRIQGTLGQRFLQRIQQAALFESGAGSAASQKLVKKLIRDRRLFASGHSGTPSYPLCPPTHGIPDSPLRPLFYGSRIFVGSLEGVLPNSGRIPYDLTSFIGRKQELAELKKSLEVARLVTIHGIGGVGKSRLTRQFTIQTNRAFRRGARLVELADLREPTAIEQAVADAFDIQLFRPGALPVELANRLGSEHALLVLDNCEHLLDDVSSIVERLMQSVPRLHVLATSREPLGLPGEYVFRLAPLAIPSATRSGHRSLHIHYDAVRLFVDRARLAGYELDEDGDLGTLVEQICVRLDGIPLALELAAMRLRSTSLVELHESLREPLKSLTMSPRHALSRHRSLANSLSWSFSLCSADEKILWGRFATFISGAQQDAIRCVCAFGPIEQGDITELVDALVQKSVLLCEVDAEGARYRMLEVVRDYGLEQLALAGELAAVRARHQEFYLSLTGQAETEWFGPKQLNWSRRLQKELPNIRAAMQIGHADSELLEISLAIAANLWVFWIACGLYVEGRMWFERLFNHRPSDKRNSGKAHLALGWIELVQGDLLSAEDSLESSRRIALEEQDDLLEAQALGLLGAAAAFRGNFELSASRYEHAIETCLKHDSPSSAAIFLFQYSEIACFFGSLDRALALSAQCIELCEDVGELWCRSYALWCEGVAQFMLANWEKAQAAACESIRLKQPLNDQLGILLVGELLAWISTARGDAIRTAELIGALSSFWSGSGSAFMGFPKIAEQRAKTEAVIRLNVPGAVLRDATSKIEIRDFSELVDRLLQGSHGAQPPHPTPLPTMQNIATTLTRRERQVARLVAQGLSNKEVAGALVIAPRTAESHVARIMDKLSFNKRAQLAAWVGSGGLRDG
ncbi:MAG: LuxR C-terminal-related transcriptional regulator [Sphingomonadaceae bacterium]